MTGFAGYRARLKDESGASLIEYAVVISLFLLIFFALLDFGRLGFNWVMTEKAMQRAVRIAAVRPPVCAGVPENHERIAGGDPVTYRFGSLCKDGGCASVSASCTLSNDGTDALLSSAANDDAGWQSVCATAPPATSSEQYRTAHEIFCTIQPILPYDATPANVVLEYSADRNLGFLGGPFTPSVQLGLSNLTFTFITPVGALSEWFGSAASDRLKNGIPMDGLMAIVPGEDLAQGTNG